MQCVREGDTVARLGGEEFAVIQSGSGLTAADATTLAERLIEAVAVPFAINGQDVGIGASIGISFAPKDGSEAETLLRKADIAMYRAKAHGRGAYRFFEAGMDAQAHARRVIETGLRGALAKGEFELYYQPIHDLGSQRVVAFEALLRWNHPLRGLHLVDKCGRKSPSGLRRSDKSANTWRTRVAKIIHGILWTATCVAGFALDIILL